MALFKLEKITKSYRFGRANFPALKEISLSINPGELIILSGPSCSGKSTLLNLLCAMIRPTTGRLFYDGVDIAQYNEEKLAGLRRREIGFVNKAGNLLPALTLLKNIELPLKLNKAQASRTSVELLTAVGLAGVANKRPADLTLDQQLRGALARALAKQPRLVLLDEPTAYLELTAGQSLMKLIQGFNHDKKTTFIISTTDPMVMAYGRRIIRLYDGKVEADETC